MPRTKCPLLSDKPNTKNLANLTRSLQAHGPVQNANDHDFRVVLVKKAGTNRRPELRTSVAALSDNNWGALLSCRLAWRGRPLSGSADVQRCRPDPGLGRKRSSPFWLVECPLSHDRFPKPAGQEPAQSRPVSVESRFPKTSSRGRKVQFKTGGTGSVIQYRCADSSARVEDLSGRLASSLPFQSWE